jgi:hypothetical protein
MRRLAVLGLLFALTASAAPRRILFVTYSAGFRHDSVVAARAAMDTITAQSGGALEVVSTEDLSLISAEGLRNFDVVFSLPAATCPYRPPKGTSWPSYATGISAARATDSNYNWPEYGDSSGLFDTP